MPNAALPSQKPSPISCQKEQDAIVALIEQNTASIRGAADYAQRELKLLREYRTHSIADAVTGRLDIRAAAAHLPDAADELELLDESDAGSDAEESGTGDTDVEPEDAEA